MPYEVGDRLIYVNQQNDSLIFTVKSKHLSEAYKEKYDYPHLYLNSFL